MLPEHERYELGRKLGEAIRLLIDVVAMLEHVESDAVLEELVAAYVADRIIEEDE